MKQTGVHLVAETLSDLIKILLYRPDKPLLDDVDDEIRFTFREAAKISNCMTPKLKKQVKKLLIEHKRQGHLAFIAKKRGRGR